MHEPLKSVSGEMAKSIRWNILPTLVKYASLPVGMLVTARLLQPGDFGTAAIATSATFLFLLLSQFGFGQAIVGLKDVGKGLVDSLFTASMLMAAALYLVLVLLSGRIAEFYGNGDLEGLLAVTGLGLFVSLATSIPLALMQRDLSYKGQALMSLWTSLASVAAVVPMAFAGTGPWALVVPPLVGNAAGAAYAFLKTGYVPSLRLDFAEVRKALNFGASAFASNVSNYLCNNAVTFAMGKAWAPAQLGQFAFAYSKQGVVFDSIASQATSSLFPILSKISDDLPRIRSVHLRMLRAALHVIPPVYLIILFSAPVFFPLIFGQKWNDAILPFQIFCLAQIFKTFALGVNPILYALGKPHVSTAVAVARFAGFAGVMAACLAMGADIDAVSWSVAAVDTAVVLLYLAVCARVLGTGAAALAAAVARPLLLSVGLAAALGGAVQWLDWGRRLDVFSFSPAAAVLLGGYLFLTRKLLRQELALLRSKL